jgi:hypothetical protein
VARRLCKRHQNDVGNATVRGCFLPDDNYDHGKMDYAPTNYVMDAPSPVPCYQQMDGNKEKGRDE